jgi:ATP/maltotriose-dependent transcriptional regulator MalT
VSTPVLATKLFAPTQRGQLVARPRLIDKLDATLDAGHRLTVVSAPAVDAFTGSHRFVIDYLADEVLARQPAAVQAEQPDHVPGLHRRASAWYASHGLGEDAVQHAFAGGDFDRAAYLVEECR